jgi:methionyl-tRNA formyltransferase
MNIRTVFLGSPDFAVPVLERLSGLVNLVGVVTQPDRPAGRGKVLSSPPIKIAAETLGIPIIQPEKLKEPFAREQILAWEPELIVVAAFGQILRKWLLDVPNYGCINVHGSLLPRWRGASPIQAAILHGDRETGISIMKMDEGIDTGDVISKQTVVIDPEDTSETLAKKMSLVGASLLVDTLPGYIHGELLPYPQDEVGVTYAGMIKPDDAILDFKGISVDIERQIRAYQPWPVAKVIFNNQYLSIFSAKRIPQAGTIAGKNYIFQKQPAIGTSDGYLILETVQPAGKKKMSGKDFLNGNRSWATE